MGSLDLFISTSANRCDGFVSFPSFAFVMHLFVNLHSSRVHLSYKVYVSLSILSSIYSKSQLLIMEVEIYFS
jgi:hypothetical protein